MADDTERLVVALEARIRDFERNFARATRTAGTQFTAIEARAKTAGDRIELTMASMSRRVGASMRGLGAGIVAGLTVGGIGAIVARLGNVAEGVAKIGDQAKRAGLDTKSFQELAFVAEQNRIEVDALTDGIKELQGRADEFITTGKGPGAGVFAQLGFSAADLKTKLKEPSALFVEIIGRLQRLDRAAQIRLSDELFGGTAGERFVQLLDQGADGIQEQIRLANELGIVLSDDVIARADELDRKFNIVAQTVGTALKGAIIDAMTALGQFIDSFNSMPNQASRTLDSRLADLGRERLDVERQMIELRGRSDGLAGDGIFGTSLGDSGQLGGLADLQRRQEAISAEEGMILRILESRQPPVIEPATALPPLIVTNNGGGGGSSRDRGASAALRERQAVADLIAELEQELRMIGATDQERRAAEASRRAGSAATDDERQRVVALTEAIYREGEALEANENRMQGFADGAKDFISGFRQDILSGVPPLEALGNAIGRLSDRIFDELLNVAFATSNGGSGGGILGGILGWVGKLFGGGLVDPWAGLRLKDGGKVRGPGTGTSDSIVARLSDGEFVVNAAATRRHGSLLEAINSGVLPAFASGGFVGAEAPGNVSRLLRGANDNTPLQAISINAPVTVNGSAGTPEQNEDLARRMAKQMEGTMRGVVADEMRRQTRPGNFANQRGR